jgi:biopolymer transport protein ExbB
MSVKMFVGAVMTFGSVAVAQATGDGGGAASSDASIQSVWDFVTKGGLVMIPIGLCSLVAFTVVVERVVSLRRSQIIPADFFPGLSGKLDNGHTDRDKAMDYCKEHPSPVANIFIAGIKRLGQPAEVVEKHIQEAGEREVFKLRKYMRLLSVIASIAPLMGLLGTIFGMIAAFQTVASSGDALGKTELLAKGIYQAMITTAAGLMLAIPVLIAYHWIAGKIESLVAEMDRLTVSFMEERVDVAPATAVMVLQRSVVAGVSAEGDAAGGNGSGDGLIRTPVGSELTSSTTDAVS